MTYTIRPAPMMDFTHDGLDDYAIVGHGEYAMSRDEADDGWVVRRLNANHSGGAETIRYGCTVVEALAVLVRSVGEPATIVFNPADHLLDPESRPDAEADDSPVMPGWVAQRIVYDPDEFGAHWRDWARCVIDANDRPAEGALIERVAWHQLDIHRPDGVSVALCGEQAIAADYVIRRVPNAIALIADPANAVELDAGVRGASSTRRPTNGPTFG